MLVTPFWQPTSQYYQLRCKFCFSYVTFIRVRTNVTVAVFYLLYIPNRMSPGHQGSLSLATSVVQYWVHKILDEGHFCNFSKMFALKVFSKTHENWCHFRQFYYPFPWPPFSICSGSHSEVRIESLWTMVRRLPVAVYAVVFLGFKIIKRYDFAPIKSESSINVMLSTFCL